MSLFLEHLLDQDHYCEWLATSLCQSDLANLPIWLCLSRIHLNSFVRLRQPGGRLAEAFLEQRPKISSYGLHHSFWTSDLHSEDHQHARLDPQAFMVREVQELLKQLTTSGPASFLLTGWWHKRNCLSQGSVDERHIGGRTTSGSPWERNTSINSIPQVYRSPLGTSRRKKVALLLESLVDKADYDKVARQSAKILGNTDVLIDSCLRWCSTVYQHGCAKIYAAARLLRLWRNMGIYLEQPILRFLASSDNLSELCKEKICKVLTELIRSSHFSVARYLQWVMADGVLNQNQTVERVSIFKSLYQRCPIWQC